MTHQMRQSDWQVLRAVLRSPNGVALGSDLRMAWSRRDKDSAHLPALVAAGLLRVAAPAPEGAKVPVAAATYALTEAGLHAAEYGEYECDRQRVAVQPRQVA